MAFDVFLKTIGTGITQFRVADAIDIIIIAVLLYHLIVFTRETRAIQLVKGLAILLAVAFLSDLFQISTLNWLLNSILVSGLIVVVVLFQPEIRRVLERIGRGRIFELSLLGFDSPENLQIINEMQQAIQNLARRRVGALIVIEQKTGLGEVIGTGTRIDGLVSAPLLENIFEPNTPLHDGAVIIRGGMIVSAACFLPLFDDNRSVARELGTRHRAALGISSVSDSITIIVSEETGVISFARDGKLVRYVDEKALHNLLESIYTVDKKKNTIQQHLKLRSKHEKK
ncbi:MAG: diadenylate cyclase CdaA [Clostridia bacterium]|nr:diadenylate cyclase CdaA [Clostridia bacterium]